MARRLQLHEKLCKILGTRKVYFQPPESVKIEYPAIVYKIIDRDDIRADDTLYRDLVTYEGSYITRDPDADISTSLFSEFKYVSFGRPFTVDNLHHSPFTIHY